MPSAARTRTGGPRRWTPPGCCGRFRGRPGDRTACRAAVPGDELRRAAGSSLGLSSPTFSAHFSAPSRLVRLERGLLHYRGLPFFFAPSRLVRLERGLGDPRGLTLVQKPALQPDKPAG